ncbi:hypothetical protein FS842_002688 [Serendipita sp. 407]|nr:hypothetical protein FS842_002688 [Serendipita sp. 407]
MLSVLKTAGFRIPTIGIPRASDPALHLSALRLSALRQLSGAARSAQSARPAWPGSGLSRSLSVKHSKFGVTPPPTPPCARGNAPDIGLVSALGRGSSARSDITPQQGASNAQLRDMLNNLRHQTDKLMNKESKTNDAIEEL